MKRVNLKKEEMISYKDGYIIQGILGVMLPILSVISCGSDIILKSISESYYLGNRDFFVGIMISLGVSFLANKGIDIIQYISNKIIGLTSIIIPLVGCESSFSKVHYICAIIFFLFLAFNCFYNWYITSIKHLFAYCGILIVFSMLFMLSTKLIFIGESIALFSFSVAYFKEGFFNYLNTKQNDKSIKNNERIS